MGVMLEVQEGEPGHLFLLQLFPKTPEIKGTNLLFSFAPLTFTEASFVFISPHSGSKGTFFFFLSLLLITTSLHSKEFSRKEEKTVELFQSKQGWITREPSDLTAAPTQGFRSAPNRAKTPRKTGGKAFRKVLFPLNPTSSIFKLCPHSSFSIYTQFKQRSGSRRGKCSGRNAWLRKLNKAVASSSIILYFIYTKAAIPLSFSKTICKESKTGQSNGNNWL